MGYTPDEPLDKPPDARAVGCGWLVDDSILAPIYSRVAPLLPQQLGGGHVAGLNARWRLYRYSPGNIYRPHVDGAWPGSGLDEQVSSLPRIDIPDSSCAIPMSLLVEPPVAGSVCVRRFWRPMVQAYICDVLDRRL